MNDGEARDVDGLRFLVCRQLTEMLGFHPTQVCPELTGIGRVSMLNTSSILEPVSTARSVHAEAGR
jgi:hypothetical protein